MGKLLLSRLCTFFGCEFRKILTSTQLLLPVIGLNMPLQEAIIAWRSKGCENRSEKCTKSRLSSFLLLYSYQGPTEPVPGNPQLVKIEILVRDSPEAGGVQVQNVTFNGKEIPLQPRDIYGNRGSAGFQLSPGKYSLRWTVQKDKFAWPRVISHEEEVTVDPRDLWLQISIVGEKASIS